MDNSYVKINPQSFMRLRIYFFCPVVGITLCSCIYRRRILVQLDLK